MLELLLVLLVAYLIGSLSFAVIMIRIFGQPDPRCYGSGNPGATNVLRSGRKAAAVLTLLGDALKGAPQYDIPRHYNVGVLFLKNDPRVIEFLDEWYASYPGHKRWLDQGSFNEMVTGKYADVFHPMEAKWNATFNVNEVPNPNIMAWHGVMPEARRFAMMKQVFAEDHLRYRV